MCSASGVCGVCGVCGVWRVCECVGAVLLLLDAGVQREVIWQLPRSVNCATCAESPGSKTPGDSGTSGAFEH